ncbi:MAG: response regulator transcription factor [Actinomycetota bacterium]
MADILVVEDDDAIRELLRRILTTAGYGVSEAPSGQQAIDFLQKGKFDLILLDVMLGRTSGFEVLEEVDRKGLRAKSRVVMVTARNSEKDFLRGWQSGVDQYLTKPFDPDALIKAVREILLRSPEELAERRKEELKKAELLYRLESAFDRP